jgi:hypothetical protein
MSLLHAERTSKTLSSEGGPTSLSQSLGRRDALYLVVVRNLTIS